MHETAPDLRGGKCGLRPGEDTGCEAAQPDEQHAHRAIGACVLGEITGKRLRIAAAGSGERRKRDVARRHGAIGRTEHRTVLIWLSREAAAVPLAERGDPGGKTLRGDVEPARLHWVRR